LKVKALIHHVPTDEDIADLLKEFTVDFLLKSYPSLVTDLRKQLMSDENADIDKSHFLWLITYFLKFASQLEVELEQIGSVLCVETVAYLTYEGVRFFEELELAVRSQRERSSDLRPHLRRIHLVVTALREFIQTLQLYGKFNHFSEKDKIKITKVQEAVCGMRELRQLFLLLIRRYNSSLQTRQYLNDIICGNHALLVMIENTKMDVEIMTAHLSQFATVEVMRQYGQLLTYFYSNSEAVNDCIFTMMHHVSGDLNAPENLFIPQVLETFSDIWEREDIEICDDWADLIEYVIQKFISTIGTRPHAYASNLLECINNSEAADENGFTRCQLDHLYSYFTQFEDAPDTVGCIIEMYKENSNVTKTRLAVIQALLSQGIISLAQYMNMMYMKSVLITNKVEHEGSVVAEVGSEKCESEGGHNTDLDNAHDHNAQNKDLETLKEILIKQGKTCLLTWLQQTLIDACYVKVNGIDLFKEDGESLEPVPFHFNYINQSIPMVAWNKNQECGLQTEHFILLLHKLGFHLATDVGKCFPRIPDHWPADHLYHLALKVGPLNKQHLKMDLTILEKCFGHENSNFNGPMSPIADITEIPVGMSTALKPWEKPLTPLTPLEPMSEPCSFAMPTPTTSWIQMALNSKKAEKSKVVNCVSGNIPRPMSIGSISDLSDTDNGSDISMEKMQIS
jgi:timeless protein